MTLLAAAAAVISETTTTTTTNAANDPTMQWAASDPEAATDVQGPPYNTPPQVTPTYDGSGQAVHPSVVDFRSPWNGYRYWMAMTPYPGASVRLENPSILTSNDGVQWSVPPGLVNPIAPDPGAPSYNSDPDIVFDPDTGKLICFWRAVVSDASQTSHTLAKTSSDGVTWSADIEVFTGQHYLECVAPSVIRKASGDWWMFAVRAINGSPGLQVYRSSNPLTGWEPYGLVSSITGWHADVTWDAEAFRLMIVDGDGSVMSISSSADGLTWAPLQTVMTPRPGQWDAKLYKASLVVRDNTWMRVWYSAYLGSGSQTVWRIAGTQVARSVWPSPA